MRETHADDGEAYHLSKAEWIAHGGTLAALVLTYLLSWGTVELNPVARRLFGTIGYPATAAVAMLAVGAGFGVFRRIESVEPRGTTIGSWSLATVGLADVSVNLWRLSEVGLPETTRIGALARSVRGTMSESALDGSIGRDHFKGVDTLDPRFESEFSAVGYVAIGIRALEKIVI